MHAAVTSCTCMPPRRAVGRMPWLTQPPPQARCCTCLLSAGSPRPLPRSRRQKFHIDTIASVKATAGSSADASTWWLSPPGPAHLLAVSWDLCIRCSCQGDVDKAWDTAFAATVSARSSCSLLSFGAEPGAP